MPFITNAGNLAARKRILAGKTEERFRVAAKLFGAEMQRIAEDMSSGRISTAELRRLGHPYARRLPVNSAPLPDFLINSQTGLFRASWKMRVTKTRDGWTVTLYNDSPYAKFMIGTSKMRERAILQRVLLKMQPRVSAEVKQIVVQTIAANGQASGPIAGNISGSYSGTYSGGGGSGSMLGAIGYAFTVGATSAAGAVGAAF